MPTDDQQQTTQLYDSSSSAPTPVAVNNSDAEKLLPKSSSTSQKKRPFTWLWLLGVLLLVCASGAFLYFYFKTMHTQKQAAQNVSSSTETPSENSQALMQFISTSDLVGIWQAGPTLESGWNERYQFYKSGKYRHITSSTNCAERTREDAGFWLLNEGKLTLVPITTTRWVGGSEATATGSCATSVMIKGAVSQVFLADYSPRTYLITAGIDTNDNTRDSIKLNDDTFWNYFKDDPMAYSGGSGGADFEEPIFSRYLKDDVYYIYKGTWVRTDPAQTSFELMLNTDGALVYGGYCVKGATDDNQECVYDYDAIKGVGVVGYIHDNEAYLHYRTQNGSVGEATMYYNPSTQTMLWKATDGSDLSVLPAQAVLTLQK